MRGRDVQRSGGCSSPSSARSLQSAATMGCRVTLRHVGLCELQSKLLKGGVYRGLDRGLYRGLYREACLGLRVYYVSYKRRLYRA